MTETKRVYHKPIYGLSKKECLTKKYRRFFNGRCSYKKCKGKSHFYNKYGKCMSMKHYGDIEPSRKKKYRGKNPRLICESSRRGSNWRYYDGKCYKKTCKTKGSVFAYYNGRCTPRPQYFKHLMNKFRLLELNAEKRIKQAKNKKEFVNIYKSAKKNIEAIKNDANVLLDKIKENPTNNEHIKRAKNEKIINDANITKLQNNSTNETEIQHIKDDVKAQGFGVLENIKNRIKKMMKPEKGHSTTHVSTNTA